MIPTSQYRVSQLLVGTVTALACADAYSRRPWPSVEDSKREGSKTYEETVSERDRFILTRLARSITIGSVSFASFVFLKGLSDFEIVHQEKFLDVFEGKEAKKIRPVLTVSNHQSIMDDPVLIANISPLKETSYDTSRMRWGLCGEDICFKNPLLSTFFGAGKVLPINRSIHRDPGRKKGGGLEQIRLKVLCDKMTSGNWVHIFPEGFCCQSNGVNKTNAGFTRPYMRWGVGKLIARSPSPPIIIPFYHDGMKEVFPQDDQDALVSPFPRFGKRVLVYFGDRIEVQDLIDHFHSEGNTFSENWEDPPTKAEQELYAAFTGRIAETLFELERKSLLYRRGDQVAEN